VHSFQTGLLDRWGIPGKPPLEEDPQALVHRVCPGRKAFPLERKDGDGYGIILTKTAATTKVNYQTDN